MNHHGDFLETGRKVGKKGRKDLSLPKDTVRRGGRKSHGKGGHGTLSLEKTRASRVALKGKYRYYRYQGEQAEEGKK